MTPRHDPTDALEGLFRGASISLALVIGALLTLLYLHHGLGYLPS